MDAEADKVERELPGRVLARERERQGLSRQEVAARIHMSPWQVEALEAGDYSRLPRGTFLRGFVRNYAKALGMQPDSLLPMIAEAAPAATPRIVVPSQNIRFDPMGERLANPYVKAFTLASVALLLGFAAMYWWVFIRPTPPAMARKEAPVVAVPAQPAPQQLASAPVTPAEAPPPQDAPKFEENGEGKGEGKDEGKGEAKVGEAPKAPAASKAPAKADPPKAAKPEPTKVASTKPADAPKPAPEAAAPTPVKAANGEARIRMRFKGESWVEVRDASGRMIFSKLNEPGTEAEVAGKPPLAVVVGNAPLVEVTYNDQAFNLEPHTRVAVARFTLN